MYQQVNSRHACTRGFIQCICVCVFRFCCLHFTFMFTVCAGLEDWYVLPSHSTSCQRHPIHSRPDSRTTGQKQERSGKRRDDKRGERLPGGRPSVLNSKQGGVCHVQCMTSDPVSHTPSTTSLETKDNYFYFI